MKNVPTVLMIGPGREVRGGISTVVNSYYDLNLDKIIKLQYISSMEDGNKLRKLLVALKAYLRFRKSLKKCDIVHIHMAAQASFTRKSIFICTAKKADKKIIIHQHSADFDDFFCKESSLKKQNDIKKTFSMADKVIVLSEEWKEFFGKYVCDPKKIIVLHNSIILPEYQKTDYSDHNVLFFGRLGRRKGSYDLLKAVPQVLKKVPDAMFFLGGDGDIEETQKIIDQNHLNDHVKLLGWVCGEEKQKYLKDSSIFILPSYHEGMPMAVLEAMGYGLATISTNVGGIPQIIENGIDGIRIDAGDVNAIIDNLIDLLNNPSKKKKIGEAGKIKIQNNFNAKENIKGLTKIYQEIWKNEKK